MFVGDSEGELLRSLIAALPWMRSETRMIFAEATPEQIRAHVERALAGDKEAMRTLVLAIAPVIQVRIARALMRRHHQAKGRDLRQELEDFMQEVFASLLANDGRALRSWDSTRGLTFLSFVGFIADREVGMIMRTGKRSPWTEDPTMDETLIRLRGTTESHETHVATRELLEQLAERLRETLSPQGRHYFQLLYVEARPVQALSKETGVSLDALYAWRSRLGKVLRQLRDELGGERG
jgi:DNA-directed RNA polymerase specialized sigma24 family protein